MSSFFFFFGTFLVGTGGFGAGDGDPLETAVGIITDRLLEAVVELCCGDDDDEELCCNAATRGLFSAVLQLVVVVVRGSCRGICGDEEGVMIC